MADAAGGQATPSFKLVLVGDGGTGKVRTSFVRHQRLLWDTAEKSMETQTSIRHADSTIYWPILTCLSCRPPLSSVI